MPYIPFRKKLSEMTILKSNLFTITAVAIALAWTIERASAQQPIGAGGAIQQIPPPPAMEKPNPVLPVEPREAPVNAAADDGARVLVRSLRVTGETLFPEIELVEASDFKPGTELSLTDLRKMAAKIANRYNQRGYFLAQAYLPPQDIKDGVVTIAVIEGRYGQIGLHNTSHVSSGLVSSVLGGLESGDPVETAPLERRLLLISDIPGIVEKATMSPGAAAGTSDLNIDLKPAPRVSGSGEADNWGNQYTGTYRLGATVNVNNLLGYGDLLSLRTLDSTTGGLFYGRASYQAQIQDATVGVAYTAFKYQLGRQFSSLDASGTEQIVSAYGSYPLIRTYGNNLYSVVDFDYRTFQDKIGATATITNKNASVLIIGLSGDHHDTFGAGGWTTYSVSGTFGNLDIETGAARQLDATTAHTNGDYAKFSGSLSRLQHLIGPLSLYGWVRGQVALKNLDISEKMELGGASGVRAYPEGEAYGDDGYIATAEARLLLPQWSEHLPGQMQLIAFVDNGYVKLNHNSFAGTSHGATRTGVGVGAIWTLANDWLVTATYAHEVGNQRATSAPDRAGALWLQVVKYF